jgi:NAD+ kinase
MAPAPVRPNHFKRLALVGQTGHSGLAAVMDRLRPVFEEKGVEVVVQERLRPGDPLGPEMENALAEGVDLLLTLGGDGTLLWGARLVAELGVPVLGINLGHMGFLTSVTLDGMEEAIEKLFKGEYTLDSRSTLEAVVEADDGSARDHYLAMNDFVIHKGGMARVTRLSLTIGEEVRDEIGRFSGDGVVIATPTGSTAYSLSAGGPIVAPAMGCILVTPICPHTLAVRPLVIHAQETVRVEAVGTEGPPLVLTVDGQAGTNLSSGETVVIRQAAARVRLIRFEGQSFFSTLRKKLNWAIRPEGER